MAPGSTLYHISFQSTILVYYLFCNLYFPIHTTKIPKIFILLSLSYLTFASGREGIDCSDPTSDGQVFVLKCHPWIGNADTHSTRKIYNRVAITHLLH